ncbi:hypothetical protein Cni_G24062 [Canna indica]|uniref:FLZ-type domain-containing protein n=1 Tax=Canna indica TaxID=4628 RepID=A0AAQ3KZJ4_9LILI|nr:hypothetical protein Cni_G24062 [Canna indica]
MLRKRSMPVSSSKQGLMSDTQSLPSSHGNCQNKPSASSFFPSPSLFRSLSSKGFSDHEAAMSPTSILETRHLSSLGHLLATDRQQKKPPFEIGKHHLWDNGGLESTGLGILDALSDDKPKESSNPQRRMVLFGSQLRIQIPSMHSNSASPGRSMELPSSPIEFGDKNKDSQLASSPQVLRSLGDDQAPTFSPRIFTGSISVSEMELSEDYTRVISHGPNPKTTHIYDNCIVESCGDEFIAIRVENSSLEIREDCAPNAFLSSCYQCEENHGQGKNNLMYRGEEAFSRNKCDHDLDKLHSTGASATI